MSRNSPRTSTKYFDRTCERPACAKVFTARRVTARFCCDICRVLDHKSKAPRTLRQQVLADHNHCDACGEEQGRKFVWFPANVEPSLDNGHVLCGNCHADFVDPRRHERRALWKAGQEAKRAQRL